MLHTGGMQHRFGYERPSSRVALDVEEFMRSCFRAKAELAVLCDEQGPWSRVSTAARCWLLSVVLVFALNACISASIEQFALEHWSWQCDTVTNQSR